MFTLDSSLVPHEPSGYSSNETACVVIAIRGLCELIKSLPDSECPPHLVHKLVDAWPGIYKWSMFLVTLLAGDTRLEKIGRSAMSIMVSFWLTLVGHQQVQEVMISTDGSLEVAAILWASTRNDYPATLAMNAAGVLHAFIPGTQLDLFESRLDRVLKASGKTADEVVELRLSRLKAAVKVADEHPYVIATHLDLIYDLCRVPNHPVHLALLSKNIV